MWTDGYVSGIDYTYGYYSELSPSRLRLAALFRGIETCQSTEPCYLELGFGQGLSINIHAAATPGTYWGTDFNPSHAAHAQKLVETTGANLVALDASFEELADRDDLPDFDIIALHGIWSWISDANRRVIVEIARRHLKPGGLFYISYNVTQGWSAAAPLRHLLTQHAERVGSGQIEAKIESSLNFANRLIDAGALYFKANPGASERFNKLKEQTHNYLAHEFFNSDWQPMSFSETASLLEEAKLEFAASAHLLDNVDSIHLSASAQNLLKEISDPVFKQTVRDYFVNQQFRRDVFVKGARRVPALEQNYILQSQGFVLQVPIEDCPKTVSGTLGEANLQEEVYVPILEALSKGGYTPKTFGELQSMCDSIDRPRLVEAIKVLSGTETILPIQEKSIEKNSRKYCKALNTELCRRAEHSGDIKFLASPLTGAGIQIDRFQQLFLRASELQENDAPDYVFRILKSQGQRILKDGKALEGDAANLDEIRKKHELFTSKFMPVYKVLGIA